MSVATAGFWVERKVWTLNSLAAAATLILCWNTNELFPRLPSPFRRGGNRALAEPTYRFLRRRFQPDLFLPRAFNARRWITDRLFGWRAPLRFVRGLIGSCRDALVLFGYADLSWRTSSWFRSLFSFLPAA
jgi:hypothetical protein